MPTLHALLAAHPLPKKPYNTIRFARIDGNGTPLYTVGQAGKEVGAATALKMAFERHGAHCFYCKQFMRPQPLSQDCTRDHLRPLKKGGEGFLHNLVYACGPCNRAKGGADLISFRAEVGSEYMAALDEHLVRCIALMAASDGARGGDGQCSPAVRPRVGSSVVPPRLPLPAASRTGAGTRA